jgi:hypothetical protein
MVRDASEADSGYIERLQLYVNAYPAIGGFHHHLRFAASTARSHFASCLGQGLQADLW